MKHHIDAELGRLPAGDEEKEAIRSWVQEFIAGSVAVPVLALAGEVGTVGVQMALARSIADANGRGLELYDSPAAAIEETALAEGGGEITILNGFSAQTGEISVREEIERTLHAAVAQAGGPRWVILLEGPYLRLPQAVAGKARLVSFERVLTPA